MVMPLYIRFYFSELADQLANDKLKLQREEMAIRAAMLRRERAVLINVLKVCLQLII